VGINFAPIDKHCVCAGERTKSRQLCAKVLFLPRPDNTVGTARANNFSLLREQSGDKLEVLCSRLLRAHRASSIEAIEAALISPLPFSSCCQLGIPAAHGWLVRGLWPRISSKLGNRERLKRQNTPSTLSLLITFVEFTAWKRIARKVMPTSEELSSPHLNLICYFVPRCSYMSRRFYCYHEKISFFFHFFYFYILIQAGHKIYIHI
jgi:hypothetical protein